MTAESMTDDSLGVASRPFWALHPLALAYAGFGAILILSAAILWMLGASDSMAPVLHLAIQPPVKAAAPQRPWVPAPSPAVISPITAPIHAGTALVADPALIETNENGPLPRIAADGRTPMQAYAAPVADAGKPRIAIVIAGLGISAKSTTAALASLPSQVTLAFAPSGNDVQHWVTDARGRGHEVLLEVPMEPFDFPDSDPGPHTLRAGVAETANTEKLVWALTRATGYTGITNLAGGRLLSDPDSLAPVMTFIARRGLLFYDNGQAQHSVSGDVAGRTGTSLAQATATIDAVQTPEEIDRQLSALETEARAHGFASGTGSLYPVTLQRVAQWAQGLSGRGFVLVPVSAIVAAKK
jgi:polysaccharide deacetylase 2 family uncharacterized protein YibQ